MGKNAGNGNGICRYVRAVLQTMYISTKQEISKIIGHHLWIFPKPKMAHNIWTKVEDSCNSDIYEVGFIA